MNSLRRRIAQMIAIHKLQRIVGEQRESFAVQQYAKNRDAQIKRRQV